ncbi:MAG: sugar isomerase [Alphaproteobacteria bacterium 62-8]|nr:MAG: sugar isomerase [Alphaproteobacteria bacterium 62-8]
MPFSRISSDLIGSENATRLAALQEDYEFLGRKLARRGLSIDRIKERVKAFTVAIPSWGVGAGGTRFARFPLAGEPRSVWEKLEDCSVVQDLGRNTPCISIHFPWDWTDDLKGLRQAAVQLGLHFGPVNSNTFQDRPGADLSYKYGSLTHTDRHVQEQAIAHKRACIEGGVALGSKALTVWIGDGTNFPGQQDFTASFDRYLESAEKIYAALPGDWTLLIEHKLYEPAFYSTVIQDWGTSYIAATHLGDRAKCLVDLGHHAPTVNIEMIVARLARFGKLGGFHFNDSKYGDDDLDAGSIDPFRLFLIFNELVEADLRGSGVASLEHMIDQSHNVTDPIESLLLSAEAIAGAYARALIVDRDTLHGAQAGNDVVMAREQLRTAYETPMGPVLAMARYECGGAIDPVAVFRASGYREDRARDRPAGGGATSAGIV